MKGMRLDTPTRLGNYELLSLLGAGGMGEVYRARDVRLLRDVAIKVFRNDVAGTEELLQRFEREARAVSSLNHPHICTLYDVGRDNGIDYLVMEFVEGETLDRRLKRGALSIDESVLYAIQIADSLDQAHRRGVVHRDLKPENIMLTKSGVKLLDFGLAKLRPMLASAPSDDLKSRDGTVFGTLPYMAPEQVRGKEADARADIFALGLVLYEMIVGQQVFQGDTAADIATAILSFDPPSLLSLRPAIPPALDHLVKRCIAKEPDERWQTARDVMLELEWIGEDDAQSNPAPRRSWRLPFAWVFAVTIVTALMTLALMNYWSGTTATELIQLTMPPPEKNVIESFSISPDGSRLALAAAEGGRTQLWIRPIGSPEARPLPGTADASYPFWSPDGQSIGFFAEGKLKKIASSGGPPQVLCDAPKGNGGAWNSDGVILFTPGIFMGLYRVSSAGGLPVPVTKLDDNLGENSHRWPWFLPDGTHYIFMVRSAESGIYVGALGSRERRRLIGNTSAAIYASSGASGRKGRLLFTRGDTLMAQAVDTGNGQLLGEPLPLASHVRSDPLRNWGSFSISTNGKLVLQQYSKDTATRRLVHFDRKGFQHGEALSDDNYVALSLSRDGKRVALQRSGDGGAAETWIMDLASRKSAPFAINNTFPVWSPEGGRILLLAFRDGVFGLIHKAVNGADQGAFLAPSKDPKFPMDWSPDGKYILYQQNNPQTRNDLMLVRYPGNGAPISYLDTAANEEDGKFSPDGRWIAYISDESGAREVYVQPFLPGVAPASRPRWRISTRSGGKPLWSREGKELFYIASDHNLMSVQVKSAAPGVFESSAPQILFLTRLEPSDTGQQYAVSTDGRAIFLLQPLDEALSSPLTVVLNWPRLLAR